MQDALAAQQRWQPPAFEALAQAGACSMAWLHPSEFGDALGARAAPYGGFALADGACGMGGGVYYCVELPLGTTKLRLAGLAGLAGLDGLAGSVGAVPSPPAPTLRGRFALPSYGSTHLLGPAPPPRGLAALEAEARAARGANAGGVQEWRAGAHSPLALDVPVSHAVLDLKRQIAREWHLPAGSQRLTIPSLLARELRDEDTLAASGCKPGMVYELACAPPLTPSS